MTQPLFVIDTSLLKDIFEGEKNGKNLLDKFNELKYANKNPRAITTMSCFLRAIFLSDSEVKIKDIQKTLNFLEIHPSFADFKNNELVLKEVLNLVKVLNGK